MNFFTFILVISCTDMVPTTSTGLLRDQSPQFKIDHLQIILQKITIPQHIIQFPAKSKSFNEKTLKYFESALNDRNYQEFIRLRELFQRNNFKIIEPQELLPSLQSINNLLKEIVCETFSYKDILIEFHLRTISIIEDMDLLDLDFIYKNGILIKEKLYLYLLFSEDSQEAFYLYCTKTVQYLLKTKNILSRITEKVHELKIRFGGFFTKFWNKKSRYLKDIISGQIKADDLYIPNCVSVYFSVNIAECLNLYFNSMAVGATNKNYENFWLTTFMNSSRIFLFKKLNLYKEIFPVEIAKEKLVAYDSIFNRYIEGLNVFIPNNNFQQNFNIMELIDHFLSDPDELLEMLSKFELMFNTLISSLRNDIIDTTKYFKQRNLGYLRKLSKTYRNLKSINEGSLNKFQKMRFESNVSYEISILMEKRKEFYFKRQMFIECIFYQESILMRINEAIDPIISEVNNISTDLKNKYELISKKNAETIKEIRKNINAYLNLPKYDEHDASSFYDPIAEYYFRLTSIWNRVTNQ